MVTSFLEGKPNMPRAGQAQAKTGVFTRYGVRSVIFLGCFRSIQKDICWGSILTKHVQPGSIGLGRKDPFLDRVRSLQGDCSKRPKKIVSMPHDTIGCLKTRG